MDEKIIGALVLIIGIGFFLGGIFLALSSIGLVTSQSSAPFNALTSGTFRLAGGIGFGALGVILIIAGAYLLIHD
jgi:hypothetical protein